MDDESEDTKKVRRLMASNMAGPPDVYCFFCGKAADADTAKKLPGDFSYCKECYPKVRAAQSVAILNALDNLRRGSGRKRKETETM